MAISKINSLALGSVAKVNSLLKASMAKINSLVNVLFSNDYSAVFDGTNDYITVNDAGGAIGASNGSVSCWFKLDTTSSGREIFRFYADASNSIRCFYHASTNTLRTQYRVGGTNYASYDSTAVENNGWHHMAYTWEIGRGESKMYIDGSNNASGSPESAIEVAFEGEEAGMFIGSNIGGGNFWIGNIDEFALFDDVLSAGEVSTIYNSGTPTDISSHSGLIGYWRFENNTDDSSANSNAITLVNGASYDSGDVP